MENLPKKKWHQKKKVFIPALIFAGMVMGSGLNGDHATTANLSSTKEKSVQGAQDKVQGPSAVKTLPTEKPTETPAPTEVPTTTSVPTRIPTRIVIPTNAPTSVPVQTQTSNFDSYNSSTKNEVNSAANTVNQNAPAGPTAQCGDGTYSYSQHHSGTCSHHGGVAQWL